MGNPQSDNIAACVLKDLFGDCEPTLQRVAAPYLDLRQVQAIGAKYFFRNGSAYMQPEDSRKLFCCACHGVAEHVEIQTVILNGVRVVEWGVGFTYYCPRCEDPPRQKLVIQEKEESSS